MKKHMHLKATGVLFSRHIKELQATWNITGVGTCQFNQIIIILKIKKFHCPNLFLDT
jgi:hypothetical protein